ncbi:hypothetical protein LCGC14_1709310 [marine sediment metagenome]|uniref:DUF4177 domain-containing protein n=1 Tax=marine sediment metagenome TaxID=412755 RepID=A0A0F9JW71_9ZZZZ
MMWEYKTLTGQTDRDLNILGSQGWELINITLSPSGGLTFYFKREVK